MEYNNYIPLEKISIRYKYFCFIDTKEYLADALFKKIESEYGSKRKQINPIQIL